MVRQQSFKIRSFWYFTNGFGDGVPKDWCRRSERSTSHIGFRSWGCSPTLSNKKNRKTNSNSVTSPSPRNSDIYNSRQQNCLPPLSYFTFLNHATYSIQRHFVVMLPSSCSIWWCATDIRILCMMLLAVDLLVCLTLWKSFKNSFYSKMDSVSFSVI